MVAHDAMNDGHTHTRALAHLLGSKERVEDTLQCLWADAATGIGNRELYPNRAGIDLAMEAITRAPECVIEFEGMRGRFTMRLSGHNSADIAALAEALSRP